MKVEKKGRNVTKVRGKIEGKLLLLLFSSTDIILTYYLLTYLLTYFLITYLLTYLLTHSLH